jgi:hypothetical protein
VCVQLQSYIAAKEQSIRAKGGGRLLATPEALRLSLSLSPYEMPRAPWMEPKVELATGSGGAHSWTLDCGAPGGQHTSEVV